MQHPWRPSRVVEHLVPYYGRAGGREIAQGVRHADPVAIMAMARALASRVRPSDVLVPMTSRDGGADRMLLVAREAARLASASVADILRGQPRPSLYDAKKAGVAPCSIDLGLYAPPGEGSVLLLDGVVDTGATATAALAALAAAGYRPRMLAFARVMRPRSLDSPLRHESLMQ